MNHEPITPVLSFVKGRETLQIMRPNLVLEISKQESLFLFLVVLTIDGGQKMIGGLFERFKQRIIINLGRPRNDFVGWFVKTCFVRENSYLELNAVKICNIKPDYKVLEVGFGPGIGLQAAYNLVKGGKGKLYGIDTSLYMVDLATKRLKQGVTENKVVLYHGSAANIPLNTDTIDRVYHCNCYYFWPSMRVIMREIYRVMKPGAIMVTTLTFEGLRKAVDSGLLTQSQVDPVKYMACLENYGFEDVRLEYKTDEKTGRPFQVIYAEIGEKPAHHSDMLSDDEGDQGDDNVPEIASKKDDNNKPVL